MTKLTKEEWQRVADIVSRYDDRGPRGEGWQSKELSLLSCKVDNKAEECEE